MAQSKRVDFLSPVGRLVQGDPFEPQTTDMQGKPLTVKTGARAGQPTQRYIANLAVPKNDPEFGPFWAQVDALARESWPQFFNGPPGHDGRPTCTHPQMSLKIMDGDGVDGNGQPNSGKEGFAGCWIIKTASSFPPKCYYKDHYAEHEQIKDKNLLRRGYFVRIGGSMESNNNPQKPGLYMNLGQIALWGLGPEIMSGPTAQQVFGTAGAGSMLPGMQPLPAMPAMGGGMQGMPPAQGMPGAAMGAPVGMPMQSPAGYPPAGMPAAGGAPLGGMPAAGGAPLGGMPGMPGMASPQGGPGSFAAPAAGPGMMPAMGGGAPMMPAQQPVYAQPNPGILAGPGGAAPGGMPGAMPGMPAMPEMPGMPAMQQQPAAPQLTAKGAASGYTLEQYRQAGYTDDVLRANGLIA